VNPFGKSTKCFLCNLVSATIVNAISSVLGIYVQNIFFKNFHPGTKFIYKYNIPKKYNFAGCTT